MLGGVPLQLSNCARTVGFLLGTGKVTRLLREIDSARAELLCIALSRG